MAATTTPLLTALLKKTTLDDDDELLKASNAALVKSKTDLEAQTVKTIALIKLDRYDDAVKLVENSGQALRDRVALGYAYALYKIGKLEQAADVAKSTKSRGGHHLEAQARYKLEDSIATAKIYSEIRKEHDATEEFDLRINRSAVDVQGQWLGLNDQSTAKKPDREDLDYFETAYNAACGSIARGELAQAEVLLKRAKELCKHNEDLSDEQKTEELLSISVQQLYVLQALGKTTDADALAETIPVDKIADLSIRAVAQSNKLMSVSDTANPFLTHKAFNSTPKLPKGDKLFSYQSIPFASNKRTIDIQAFKFDGMKAAPKVSKDKSAISPEVLLSSIFSAASHGQNEVSKAAIKKVLPELSRRPEDVGLVVTLVQMYVLTENIPSAIDLMESFFKGLEASDAEDEQDLRFNPGLISVLISLYQSQGRRTQIRSVLARAASHWLHKPKAPSSLLRAAGSSLLESSDPEDTKLAAEIFSKLHDEQPDDKSALAGFVASHAASSHENVLDEAEKLAPVAELTAKVDVDDLEKAGIPRSSNANALSQLTRSRKRAAPDVSSSKPKRARKSRLPKDYDPEKKADPERWLPMKDRSYYRAPKGKRKGKKGGDGGTQGGAVDENLNIDAKASSGGPAVGSGGAGAGGGGGGGGGGKKKGKKR